jgi:hypothetical protein
MPHGGALTIETSEVPGPAPRVRIAVSDTGTGMTPEVRSHAFDPFFTTDSAAGTGLGLSTAYGVVRAAGGEITLDSQPGGGTTVSIDLPAHRGAPAHGPAPRPAPDRGAGQRLLVVEDDDAVRDLVAMMLRRGGYLAVCAATPAEALDVFEHADGGIDGLVTDMVMAGMTGLELARAARARDPRLPVLLMSGYTAGTLPDGAALPGGMELIRKPFATEALLHAVAGVLAAAGPPDAP